MGIAQPSPQRAQSTQREDWGGNAERGMRNAEWEKARGKRKGTRLRRRLPPSPRLRRTRRRASLGTGFVPRRGAKRKPGRPPTEGKALRFPGLRALKAAVLMPQAFAPSCLVLGPGLVAPAKSIITQRGGEKEVQSSKFKVPSEQWETTGQRPRRIEPGASPQVVRIAKRT